MKTKTYTVRYFIPRVGADGKQGSIAAILDRISAQPNKIGTVREAGSMVHQVRVEQISKDKKEYFSYFVRFRDELPRVGNRSSAEEKPPELGPEEEMLEKNHFVLFVDKSGIEVLAYQVTMEGSDVNALARYFTFANGEGETVSFDDVLTKNALDQLRDGVLRWVEFEVAKPRSKHYAPDPNDTWTADAMDYMAKAGATRFRAKILTNSKKNGLLSGIKDNVNRILHSTQTKRLVVKVSGVDHPIDLFADRVFDKVTVGLHKGWPNSATLFSEMATARRQNGALEPYLVRGNEALD